MSSFFVASLGRTRGEAGQENMLDWSRLLASGAAPAHAAWTIPEAFLAILIAAASCDGEVAAVEREEIVAIVHRSRALKSLSSAQLNQLQDRVTTRLNEAEGALGEACAALPQDMRLSVFAHALDLVLADGELTEAEADFLNTITRNFGLDGDAVRNVADVMIIKNQV